MRYALSLTLLLLSGCATLGDVLRASTQTPTATHQETKLESVNLDSATVSATFQVKNPNAIGVSLAGLDWAFALDGEQLLKGDMPTGITIPANGSTLLKVPVTIPYASIPSLVTTFKTKNEAPYQVAAKVAVKTPIGVVSLPIKWDGLLPLPKLPSVSMTAATVQDVSLSGAQIMMKFAVKNPNVFKLPLDALGGKVSVAGQSIASLALAASQPLEAGKTTVVSLPINVSFLSTGLAVANAITSGTATVALDGQAKVAGKALPLSLKTSLSR